MQFKLVIVNLVVIVLNRIILATRLPAALLLITVIVN